MKVYLKSNAIRKYLIKKNRSQNWLASRAEISSAYMSQMMTHKRCPSPKMREILQQALHIDEFNKLFQIK